MHRRALLASFAGFAALPSAAPQSTPPTTPTPSDTSPAAPDAAAPGDPQFDGWLADFRARAAAQGWSPQVLDLAFAGLAADPHVVALDQRQPEFSKPISAYLAGAVTDGRVATGTAKLDAVRDRVSRASASTGVPIETLGAVWGIESSFGAIQGDDDVIRSLATLAAKGRRRAWAEAQLFAALTMLRQNDVARAGLKGSWAGAMGQTQFSPQDYLDYAVDGDGDGRRDIWGSPVDALASTANFLGRKAAWRAGEPAFAEVVVPRQGFDYALVEGPGLASDAWRAFGLTTPDGSALPAAGGDVATLLMPMGWKGPGILAYPNFTAIRAYNNAISYALAVALLARRLGGGAGLLQPWPDDQPLSRDDRLAAQNALVRLGYDPGTPDGVFGAGTRKAAKAWQTARGLPADGYLSYDLVQRLKADTGAQPAAS